MAKFNYTIDVTVYCIYSDESSTCNVEVELSDDEVKDIIELIHETDTTDVEDMQLQERLPEIYNKLEDACWTAAIGEARAIHVKDGYHNNYYEYDIDDVRNYCEINCGYEFKFDKSKYLNIEKCEDDDFEEDDDDIFYRIKSDMNDDFEEWLNEYIESLPNSKAAVFIERNMEGDTELQGDEFEYEVELPPAIIEMAELRQDK